jgi:GDPmannose 4,6-dehydratase
MINKGVAVITGLYGQDASYLAKYLLDKNYKVVGFSRRSGSSEHWRHKVLKIEGHPNLSNMDVDITEYHNVLNAVDQIKPEMIFNLCAMSFVATSFSQPFLTNNTNYIGVLNLIDAIKMKSPDTKLYQASTSEMFGDVLETPQNENTPFNPVSPYGISKLASHFAIKNARKSDNLFACSGILFNHTGPLRGEEFVSRKITKGIANIYKNYINGTKINCIELGNIYSLRDWGHSKDYCEAMFVMLQQDKPDDFVISTGETHTIKEFINEAFGILSEKIPGYKIEWFNENQGIKEYAVDNNDSIVIKINEKFFRPNEVNLLIGDSYKAKEKLGWIPQIKFKELVKEMVEADIVRIDFQRFV